MTNKKIDENNLSEIVRNNNNDIIVKEIIHGNRTFKDASRLALDDVPPTGEICKGVAKLSDRYEMENTELKREYIISNIMLYNSIVSTIKENMGSFGTGYPFYALNSDLTGALPVFGEQIRYNDELYKYADETSFKKWFCSVCLKENSLSMPDLKRFCNPCLNMDKELKPRRLLSRLPDLDLWMVCHQDDIIKASKELEEKLHENGFTTSDVDPLKTIQDLEEIVGKLSNGKMPEKKLPIDTHIIDNLTLYTLIEKIPATLHNCYNSGLVPYLPIMPLSLRKKWQHDDEAYNFVYDYLAGFLEFNMDNEIQDLLNSTRREIAKTYSLDELYKFMMETGTPVNKRRAQNKQVREYFDRKVESWRGL